MGIGFKKNEEQTLNESKNNDKILKVQYGGYMNPSP